MSYIKKSAASVIRACDAYLIASKEQVEREREGYVQFLMKQKYFFSRKNKTREDAIKELKSDHWGGYNMILVWASEGDYKVEQLKKLATLAEDGWVMLDETAVKRIGNYFEKL